MPLNLTSELTKSYNNLINNIDTRLVSSYSEALKQIQNIIKDVYAKLGVNPSMTEIMKYNRLSQYETQMLKSIKELNKSTVKAIGGYIETTATGSYKDTLDAIAKSGLGFDFNSVELNKEGLKRFVSDDLWIDAMTNNSTNLWTDIKREFETVLRANSKEEIIAGVSQGKSYNEIAKSIEDRFEVSRNRSKMIAFTETHKAHSYGRNEGINSALTVAKEAGIVAKKVWRHNGVGKPREEHIDADGQIANENGMFNVGGEEMEAPGLGSDPANNIYCHCSAEFEVDENSLTEKQVNEYKETNELSQEDYDKLIAMEVQQNTQEPVAANYLSANNIGTTSGKAFFNNAGQVYSTVESSFQYGKVTNQSQLNKAKKLLESRHGIKPIVVNKGIEFPIDEVAKIVEGIDKIMTDLRARVPYFDENHFPIRVKLINDYRESKYAVASYNKWGADSYIRIGVKQRVKSATNIENIYLKYYKDYSEAKITLGSNTAGTNFASNLRHELGHHIEFGFTTYRDKQGVGIKDIYDKYGSDFITKKISKYASSSLQEFIAESFSVITDPIYFKPANKQRLPQELEDWLVEFLKIRR